MKLYVFMCKQKRSVDQMYRKTIPCPHCGKMTIEVHETPSSLSEKRGFTGKKGLYLYKGGITYLTTKCPNCGKDPRKKEEKRHEERIRRLKEAGLPTRISE